MGSFIGEIHRSSLYTTTAVVQQCEVVTELIESTKHSYYTSIIDQHQSDQKVLFSTFAKVLHVNSEKHYPECSSSNQFANFFADFL